MGLTTKRISIDGKVPLHPNWDWTDTLALMIVILALGAFVVLAFR